MNDQFDICGRVFVTASPNDIIEIIFREELNNVVTHLFMKNLMINFVLGRIDIEFCFKHVFHGRDNPLRVSGNYSFDG